MKEAVTSPAVGDMKGEEVSDLEESTVCTYQAIQQYLDSTPTSAQQGRLNFVGEFSIDLIAPWKS